MCAPHLPPSPKQFLPLLLLLFLFLTPSLRFGPYKEVFLSFSRPPASASCDERSRREHCAVVFFFFFFFFGCNLTVLFLQLSLSLSLRSLTFFSRNRRLRNVVTVVVFDCCKFVPFARGTGLRLLSLSTGHTLSHTCSSTSSSSSSSSLLSQQDKSSKISGLFFCYCLLSPFQVSNFFFLLAPEQKS